MKKYSSKRGFYKYYNKNGLQCRIKISKNILQSGSKNYTIKFKRPQDDSWLYTLPKTFDNPLECIDYIVKNLETDRTIFKVI